MGFRILVVDDSPVLRVMLSEMLQELGHEVVAEVESGNGALEAYPKYKPDLVCLDISLPDINGMEVLKKLRRSDPRANVLIVTGNDQKALEPEALSLRALGVLHKPFDAGELKEMLERLTKLETVTGVLKHNQDLLLNPQEAEDVKDTRAS